MYKSASANLQEFYKHNADSSKDELKGSIGRANFKQKMISKSNILGQVSMTSILNPPICVPTDILVFPEFKISMAGYVYLHSTHTGTMTCISF